MVHLVLIGAGLLLIAVDHAFTFHRHRGRRVP
jgi:hypothetical protein